MDITIAAKIKIIPTEEQIESLKYIYKQILLANNDISKFVFDNQEFNRNNINKAMYYDLRGKYSLKSPYILKVLIKFQTYGYYCLNKMMNALLTQFF